MSRAVSTIWRKVPSDAAARLEKVVDRNCGFSGTPGKKHVFFRADDIAIPSENFSRLISLFSKLHAPLSAAVVPAWLTESRWRAIQSLKGQDDSLWCWHQHGWRHVNHATRGKKREFGDDRPVSRIRSDLQKGMDRLRNIMGEGFFPAFTPPWNRCGAHTLEQLCDLGFKVVSRSRGGGPPAPSGLKEFAVNVDLHTRKEKDPAAGWDNLLGEIGAGLANGMCGIMVHHQLMNAAAFLFLEHLIETLSGRKEIRMVHMADLSAKFTKTDSE